MKTTIFDLDGTLCNISHRLHHVTNGNKNWDAFFDGISGDDVAMPILGVLHAMMASGYKIVLVSGRPEKCRTPTIAWLHKHQISYDALYMRPADDHRPDHIVKMELLDRLIQDGYDPFIVVDDRESVVQAWRGRGLTCLQCAPTRPFGASTPGLLTLMIGPSGAGKTRWLKSMEAQNMGITSSQIISSDDTRRELCGDFRDQTRNDDVFDAVHAQAKARLSHGLPVTIDATHIRRKDRIAAAGINDGGPVRYLVFNRSLDRKLASAGWRKDVMVKGKSLIEYHENVFQSNEKSILSGDDMSNVDVVDMRVAQ